MTNHAQSPASPLLEAAEPVAEIRNGVLMAIVKDGRLLKPDGSPVPDGPLYAAPSPVAQAPAQAGEVARLVKEAKEAFNQFYLDVSDKSHRGMPSGASVHLAIDRLAAIATQPPAAPVQQEAEAVTVSVEEMVESVNGVSWWVVIRRGKHRQDDGKYGADFKNRAEWHAAGLRWILGQSDKPNIRDFMDISPTAPAAAAEPSDGLSFCGGGNPPIVEFKTATLEWEDEHAGEGAASLAPHPDCPNAFVCAGRCSGDRCADAMQPDAGTRAAPLAPREPLTDARIRDVWDTHVGEPTANYPWSFDDFANFARAIERAHGIAASPAGAEGAGNNPSPERSEK